MRPSLSRVFVATLVVCGASLLSLAAGAAPVVSGVQHAPALPKAGQAVTITASAPGATAVTLFTREDRDPAIAYTSVAMADDGQHGDGAAGDGRFGATVAGLADGLQLDFYIEATDATGTSVAPAGHATADAFGRPSQTFLCKFTDEVLPTDFPVYHLLVTLANKHAQEALATYPERLRAFDATFIDATGSVWYNVTERYRGESGLFETPSSYRVDFPADRKFPSALGFPVKTLELSAMRPAAQWLAFNLFDRAGLPAPRVGWARLRFPGIDYDTCCSGQNGFYGLLLVVESVDDDFLASQGGAVPDRGTSAAGNLYRGRDDADLRWEGSAAAAYRTDASGRNGYEKRNHVTDDSWADLVALADALSNTSDADFAEHVRVHLNEDAWARYFAVQVLLGTRGDALHLEDGDNFFLYAPAANDPLNPAHPGYGTTQLPADRRTGRTALIPAELDAALWDENYSLWATTVASVQRFLQYDAFAPLYVAEIEAIAADEFSPATMNALIDAMPNQAFGTSEGSDRWPETKQQYKNWIANRIPYLLAETSDVLTFDNGPWITHEGIEAAYRMTGRIQQAGTYAVTVNGVPADIDVVAGTWSFILPLDSGSNPVTILALDRQGTEKDRIEGDVFFNPAGPTQLHLSMRSPRRMVNDKTLTIEAAIVDPIGRIAYEKWNELGHVSVVRLPARTPVAITNTVFDPHVAVPDDSIRFMSGWGSVSFTLDEGANFTAGDIEVTVTWGALAASRTVTVLRNPTFRSVSGSLTAANLTWGPNENIRVTGNITIAAGRVLTINPGTLVQVNTTGTLENGTLFTIQGTVQALGTRDNPIFFFSERGPLAMTLTQSGSASNANAWRGFQFYGTGTSTLRQVFLTGAGNGNVVSHPRPPILGMFNTHSLYVDRCVFADNDGMMFSGQGTGTYTIRKSLISRAGIGGEFFGNGHKLYITSSWFTGVGHAPEANNLDGDLMHIDGAASTQVLRSSVFTDGGDDGIDHSGSSFRVEHSIITGVRDKATSMTNGHGDFHNVLLINSGTGIRGFASTSYSTIAVSAPIGTNDIVQTSIFWPSSTPTCTGTVSYTDVGSAADLGCGTGNYSANPQFTNTAANDYNPRPGSRALTAGPNQDRIGWLGFPYGSVCATTADCNDTNACTTDTCVNKLCTFTAIVGCVVCDIDEDCDDGQPCTVDTCGADGGCVHTSRPDGTSCTDGKSCTSPDTCTGGVCGGPVSCPNNGVCNATGGCGGAGCANDAACNDGQFCNGTESCIFLTRLCRTGVAPVCDDSIACTADACSETEDRCVYTPSNALCDDDDPCTDDVCDAAIGCRHTPNTAACDDGDPCTTGDTCAAGACVGGAAPACDDGLACTTDRCDALLGCAHDDTCGDGFMCSATTGVCEVGPQTVTFQDGRDGYTGTVDTYLQAGAPDESHATATTLTTDGTPPAGDERQILLRFEDIFGDALGQIPLGARIVSATLTLYVTNPSGDVIGMYPVRVSWDDEATWNELAGGVQIDGTDASATADWSGTTDANKEAFELDVTDVVLAWSAGGQNLGWVFVLPDGGTDSWQFASSEDVVIDVRPALTIEYVPCERGYVGNGVTCSDLDECQLAEGPCDPNADCTNSVGSFECECRAGFLGDGETCTDVDECAETPCGANATCTNAPGTYACACDAGFEGDGTTCADIDECAADPCDVNATCENSAGTYACTCLEGYAGNGATCADIDECADDPCDPNAACTNSDGSFACDCLAGFDGDGATCTDIDECAASPCDPNATCANAVGTFACDCNPGFEGNGATCADIDECTANPCGANATCVNAAGTFTCACPEGYVSDGVACGECPGGAADPCSGHGDCGGTPAAPSCACDPYFGGASCEACAPGSYGYPSCLPCPVCDDGDLCTTDSCDAAIGCRNVAIAGCCTEGPDCAPPGSCLAGVCDTERHVCATPEAIEGCCTTNDECDDGDADNVDTCVDGTCQNVQPCANDAECDDGDPCIENVCEAGRCVDSDPIAGCCAADAQCDDGDRLTLDVCDPIANTCSHTPTCALDADCDDGDPLTLDACDLAARACTHTPTCGTDADCDDGNPSTIDTCDPVAHTCSHETGCANDAACDDADACTTDVCQGGLCVHTPIAGCCANDGHCVDGDPCTADSCVEGACVHTPTTCCTIDFDCDDADPCTIDACFDGVCVRTPVEGCCATDAACADGDPCTTDVCADGYCTHGVVEGCCHVDTDCDDGDATTTDTCEASTGVCSHAAECSGDGECEDGDPCTTNTCADGTCASSPVEGCCATDADCAAPAERCADQRCVPVLCNTCEEDADCGAAGNLCLTFASGKGCGVACTEDAAACPEGSTCGMTDRGVTQCQPIEGDCTCTSHAGTACSGGQLLWFTSCGGAEDVADDCSGRGCVAGACCTVGTHASGELCIPDTTGPDVVGPGPDVSVDVPGTPDTTGPGDPDVSEPGDSAGGGDTVVTGKGGGGSSCDASGGSSSGIALLALLLGLALPLVRARRRQG